MPVDVWLPLLTLVLGYVGSLVTEALRDKRTREREREARKEAARLEAERQHRAFQRETLIELQEALQAVARGAGMRHHLDTMEFRRTGEWGGARLSEEAEADEFAAGTKALLLQSRVDDEQVRQLAKDFNEATSRHSITRYESEETADAALIEAVDILETLHDRIGYLLRTVY